MEKIIDNIVYQWWYPKCQHDHYIPYCPQDYNNDFIWLSCCCHAPLRRASEGNNTAIDYVCTKCGNFIFHFFVYKRTDTQGG